VTWVTVKEARWRADTQNILARVRDVRNGSGSATLPEAGGADPDVHPTDERLLTGRRDRSDRLRRHQVREGRHHEQTDDEPHERRSRPLFPPTVTIAHAARPSTGRAARDGVPRSAGSSHFWLPNAQTSVQCVPMERPNFLAHPRDESSVPSEFRDTSSPFRRTDAWSIPVQLPMWERRGHRFVGVFGPGRPIA
jgi:hypothetical protein